MTTIKTTQLANAGVLDGTEKLVVVKGGVSKQTTSLQVANLFAGASGTEVVRSAGYVSGIDKTGLTASNSGFETIISTGGAWFVPAGDYLITGGGVDGTRSKSLWIMCDPGARFFTNADADALEGDFFNFDVPSGGVGLPTEGLTTEWIGGVFDARNVKNSTSLPFSATYPGANVGAAATGDCLSFRDTFTSGTLQNGSSRIRITNVTFYAGTHWETAGGDQAIYADGYDHLVVEGCTFIGWRDLGVYASGDSTGAISGHTKVVGNRFENCVFGVAIKRGARSFEIAGNTFFNCVGGININEIIGGMVADGVIVGNAFEECGIAVRLDYATRVTVRDNAAVDMGASDASGDLITVYAYEVYQVNGCEYCTLENNRAEGMSAAATTAGVNYYLLGINDFTTAAAVVMDSQYNVFRRNVGVDIYGAGSEASGEADNNHFDENYVTGGTVAHITTSGAGSSVVRWDAANSRRVYTTPLGFGDGSASAPTIARFGQTTTGLFFATNKVGATVAGTERFSVTNTAATLAAPLTFDSATTARRSAAGIGTWYVVAQSGVKVTRSSANAAGDATEETLVTVTIPAGAIGPNGSLRWRVQWSYTNSANAKTLRARFGGASGTIYASASVTTTAGLTDIRQLFNRNSASSQVGTANGLTGGIATTTGTIATSAIDTTAAVDLLFRGNWAGATAAEEIAVESYCVEVCYGA